MATENWTWTTEVTLPSELDAGGKVKQEIQRQLALHDWEEQDVFAVQLALEEALVNAIKHGNQLDADKCVRLACRLSQRRIRIEVTDEGPGFDPSEVPDPTAEENLEIPCGRGVMLIRSFMTSVTYNDKGNHVVMEKTRE